jgi:hypothetical protein
MKSNDSDESSGNEGGDEEDQGDQEERYSLNSSDEESEESDQDEVKGGDTLMADEIDIPRVDDIPVVSKLAAEKKDV